MKRLFVLIITFLCLGGAVGAQATFEVKPFGFSMNTPKGWILSNKQTHLENLEKFDITDANLDKILDNAKGDIQFVSYHKYDPKITPGIIPTINVNVRRKSPSEFQTFKKEILQSAEGMRNQFEQFEFSTPTDVNVDGIPSISFVMKFVMRQATGESYEIRTRVYAIPMRTYFIQVNFIDAPKNEDCSSEFDELARTMKMLKKS